MAEAMLLKQCSIAGVISTDDRERSCFHPSPNEYFASSARVARSSVMSLGAESQAHRKRSSGAGGRRRLSRGLSRSRSGMLTKEERAARRTVRELQMVETAYREQKKRMAVRKKAALAQQRAWACAQGGAGGQTKVAATALLLAQDELHGSPFRDGGGGPGSPPAAAGLMSRLTRLSRRSRLRGQRRYGGGPPSPVLPRPAEGVAWGVVSVDADLFFDPIEREAVLRRKRRTRALLRDRSSLQGTGTCLVLGGLQQASAASVASTTTYAEHVALCVAEAVLLLQEDRDAPLFTQLRHPLPREDRVLRFTLPPTTAPHIVVFYKGNGYLIEVLEVGGGERRVAPPPLPPTSGGGSGSGGGGTADLLQQAKEEAARTKPPPVRAISAYELHKHLQLIMEGAAEDSLFLSNGKVAYSSSYLEEADRSSRAGGGAAGRRQAGLSAHPVPYSQVSRRSRDEAASLVPLVDRDGQPLEVRRQRSLIEVEECDGESFDDDDSWGWGWEYEEEEGEEYEEAEEEEEYESDEEEVAPYRQVGYHHHHAEPEHLTDATYLNLCLNTAAFVVTIAPDGDEDPPDSPGDVAARVLRRSDGGGGGGGSQALLDVWCGKALHLVFFPNKRTAVLTEPTIVTEHTSAVFATKLHKRVVAREPTYRERNELWAYISRLEFIAEAEWFCLSFKELVKELEAGRLSELNNKTAPRAALETLLFARLRDSPCRAESKRRPSQMTRQSELRLHQLIEETRKQKPALAAKSALGGADGGRGPASLHPAFRDLYPHVIVTANVYDAENPILHNPHHPFDKTHEGNAGFISFAPGESSGATKPFSLFRRTFWEPFSDLVTSTIPLTMMTAKVHDTKPHVAPRRGRRAPAPNAAEVPPVAAVSQLAKLPERSAGLVTRMKAAYRLPARAHRSVEYFEVGVQSLARRGLDTPEKRELWMTVVLHYAYHTLHQGVVKDPVHRALLHTYDEANASVPHDVANGTSAKLTRLCDSLYCGGAGHPAKKAATRDLTCQLFAYLEGGLRGIMERGDVSVAGARSACELHTIAIPEDCASAVSAIAPSNPRPLSAALAASFCLMPDSVLVSLSAPEALLKPFTVHVRGAIRTVRDLCNPRMSLGVLED